MFQHIKPHQTLLDIGESEVYRVLSDEFKHIKLHQTSSKSMLLERARCAEFCHKLSTPNPIEPPQKHAIRESNVCRVCHMVQPHQTSLKLLKINDIREQGA